MTRRGHSSVAVDNTLSTGAGPTDATITVSSTLSGWPATTPYTLVIDPGTGSEEVCEVTGVPFGTTYPVNRGVDGSSARSHSSGAVVSHRISARDVDEPNAHIAASAGVHGLASGDTVVGASAIAGKASDIAVVHLAGAETITGVKTFAAGAAPVFQPATIPTAAVSGLSALVPSGSIVMFGSSTAPTGWLLCDGSAVDRTTYANLFAAIGISYGGGDGTTTFNLPNFAGLFPRQGTPGTTGGATSGTTSAHTHNLSDNGQAQITVSAVANNSVQERRITTASWTSTIETTTASASAASIAENTGTPLMGATDAATATVPTVPPFLGVAFIVKV